MNNNDLEIGSSKESSNEVAGSGTATACDVVAIITWIFGFVIGCIFLASNWLATIIIFASSFAGGLIFYAIAEVLRRLATANMQSKETLLFLQQQNKRLLHELSYLKQIKDKKDNNDIG